MRHPALFGTSVYRYEIQLILRRIQRKHQIEYLLVDLIGTAVRFIDLVDHHERFFPESQGLLQNESRLRHRSLEGIHEQQHTVGHIQHPFHLASEVGVPRSVDDIDLISLVIDRYIF